MAKTPGRRLFSGRNYGPEGSGTEKISDRCRESRISFFQNIRSVYLSTVSFFHGKGFYSGYESKKYNSLEEQLKHSNHSEFWLEKIKKNMERDQQVNCLLAQQGWKVLRFWSKDVLKNVDQCLLDIEDAVRAV